MMIQEGEQHKRPLLLFLLIAFAACIVAFGAMAIRLFPNSYRRHFDKPLPSGSALIHYASHRAGWSDMTYGFAFKVSDNALRDILIHDWQLQLATDSSGSEVHEKLSPSWWPTVDELSGMECYRRVDNDEEEFKTIWSDTTNAMLYVEYGNW
jgi:hypothetical protein